MAENGFILSVIRNISTSFGSGGALHSQGMHAIEGRLPGFDAAGLGPSNLQQRLSWI